jgi:hypothetical protein
MSAPPTRSTGGNHRNESLRLQLLPARAFFLLPLPQPDTWAPAVLVDELHPGRSRPRSPFLTGMPSGQRRWQPGQSPTSARRQVYRRAAGLHRWFGDKAWWQLLKESQHVPPLELSADDHVARRIDAMNLKD